MENGLTILAGVIFSANGEINARLWDGTNAGIIATGNVENIDKTAPVISFSYLILDQHYDSSVSKYMTMSITTFGIAECERCGITAIIREATYPTSEAITYIGKPYSWKNGECKFIYGFSATDVDSGVIAYGYSSSSSTRPDSWTYVSTTTSLGTIGFIGAITDQPRYVWIEDDAGNMAIVENK